PLVGGRGGRPARDQVQQAVEAGMRSVAEIFRSYGVLDTDGRHTNGTDKETNHRYGDAYEHILGALRTDAKLVMEVGVADGSSLLAWREVFPNALCVGMDIHPTPRLSKLDETRDRISFYLGDQCSRIDCEEAARGRQF